MSLSLTYPELVFSCLDGLETDGSRFEGRETSRSGAASWRAAKALAMSNTASRSSFTDYRTEVTNRRGRRRRRRRNKRRRGGEKGKKNQNMREVERGSRRTLRAN